MIKILIVDDEKHSREGLRSLLETLELQLVLQTAEDGVEGFEKACLLPPDILISDIRMSKCDGLEMLKRLREHNVSIPYVYLLTGYSEFTYAQQAIHYGVSEYILKPIVPQAMLQLIRRDAVALEKAPADISLDGRRLILVSEDENPAMSAFVKRQGYPYLLVASVYMENQRHLPDDLKAELLRRKDLYVVTPADRHYRGIMVGLRQDQAEDVLYSLQLLFASSPTLTLCHTLYTPTEATDWHGLFERLTNAIAWSISLGSNFFSLAQTQDAQPASIPDDALYRAALNKLYAAGNYTACRDTIVQKLMQLCHQHRRPELIQLAAASSLYRLNTGSGGDTSLAEARHVAVTNRISAAKTQRELFAAVNDYFNAVTDTDSTSTYSRPVSLALREIDHRYPEPLSLQNVAAALKITPQYLNRLFAKELNLTFNDYLTRFRLEKACEMLRHGNMRINQIAQNVGYADAKYFCTLFKRVLCVTPGQYRTTNQHE